MFLGVLFLCNKFSFAIELNKTLTLSALVYHTKVHLTVGFINRHCKGKRKVELGSIECKRWTGTFPGIYEAPGSPMTMPRRQGVMIFLSFWFFQIFLSLTGWSKHLRAHFRHKYIFLLKNFQKSPQRDQKIEMKNYFTLCPGLPHMKALSKCDFLFSIDETKTNHKFAVSRPLLRFISTIFKIIQFSFLWIHHRLFLGLDKISTKMINKINKI